MAHNYLIAIGGTGARCLEAFVYLMACGLMQSPLRVLIIDSENNNGNGRRTEELIQNYDALHLLKQPANPTTGILRRPAPPPTVFQASVNRSNIAGQVQDSLRWVNQNDVNLTFSQVIHYTAQPAELQQFISLFYAPDDLIMPLRDGYRAKPNIGAVALKQALENTLIPGNPLHTFLQRLNTDLQAGEARVFVFGSVFGGTGAAGLPIIPSLINELPEDGVISKDNRSRIKYGCTMLKPYFSFPRTNGNSSNGASNLDSSRHDVATQAALLHYSQTSPNYNHVYLIGAPSKVQTNEANIASGERQENRSHYIEVVAALAALDFFSLDKVSSGRQKLHYAETTGQGGDLGVTWETLPVSPAKALWRQEIKKKWINFTTFAYFYHKLIHDDFINHQPYKQSLWYRNNFSTLSLDTQSAELGRLYDFTNSYLLWLNQIGQSFAGNQHRLFSWNAIDDSLSKEQAAAFLSILMDTGGQAVTHSSDSYDKIFRQMDAITLRQPGTNSPTGLFIYLLYQAVAEFCRKNYNWK